MTTATRTSTCPTLGKHESLAAAPVQQKHNFRASLSVLGAAVALFCTSGFMNAFGLFQEYYAQHQLSDKSAFDISWIGSFAMFMMLFGAGLAGVLVDRTGPTILICAGSIGIIFAIFMTSLCSEYYQFFLAQSLLFGLSISFLLTPPIATVSLYFTKKRGLALGIAISGSSLGGVIWPILINQLLNHREVSFGWAMRVVGFTMIPLLATACIAIRAPLRISIDDKPVELEVPQELPKKKLDLSILKNPAFLPFALGLTIFYLGMISPFFFISTYATSLGESDSFAFYLISIMNATSMFGRIIPGLLADRYGAFNACSMAAILSGIIGFTWTAVDTSGGLIAWSMAYGFASGAILSLQITCAAQISSPESRGTSLGLAVGASALTGLFGTPISGQLINHGYLALSMYVGSCLTIGGLFITWARIRQSQSVLVKI